MNYLTLSRILFIAMMINDAIVMIRSAPETRKSAPFPRFFPVSTLVLFVPIVFAINLPEWLAIIAVAGQVIGLALEIAGEIQLARASSFSVSPLTPIQPQSSGLYRFLENPIYLGILLQFAAWALWLPLLFIPVALQYEAFRRGVSAERAELSHANFTLRRMDSPLWN
jgi:protein-S-isoprenylcysteine O-methyltransferase Ste14